MRSFVDLWRTWRANRRFQLGCMHPAENRGSFRVDGSGRTRYWCDRCGKRWSVRA